MKKILINFLYLITIPAITALSQNTLSVRKMREPGDRLDISIRQELEHTTYNGVTWLKEKQKADGSFGDKDTRKCTAVAIVALSGADKNRGKKSITKALNWLENNLPPKETTNFNETAWCCVAIIIGNAALQKQEPQTLISPSLLVRQYPATTGSTTHLYSEIILSTAPAADTENFKRIKVNTTEYIHTEITFLEMWLNARSINSQGGQLLTNKGNRIDWRGKYASKLIGKQKIDPKGGGYWINKSGEKSIYETALAILISKEL